MSRGRVALAAAGGCLVVCGSVAVVPAPARCCFALGVLRGGLCVCWLKLDWEGEGWVNLDLPCGGWSVTDTRGLAYLGSTPVNSPMELSEMFAV